VNYKTEGIIRELFRIGIVFKWIFASWQIIAGTIILFISQNAITRYIILLTQEELTEDAKDYLANHLLKFGASLSYKIQVILAVYLLTHGIIKFCLLYGLWKEKLHFYPMSALVFSIFFVYQMHRYYLNHTTWLLILSIFDIVYIWLILHEYKLAKRQLEHKHSRKL